MKLRKIKKKSGKCSRCHSPDLKWGEMEILNEKLRCPWVCTECKTEGYEWYRMYFTHHSVTKMGKKNVRSIRIRRQKSEDSYKLYCGREG